MVTKTIDQSTGSRLDMVRSVSMDSNIFSRNEIYFSTGKSKLFIISDIYAEDVSKQIMVLSDTIEKHDNISIRMRSALLEAGICINEPKYYGKIYVDTKARLIEVACASVDAFEEPDWECVSRFLSEGFGNIYNNFNVTMTHISNQK